MRLALILLFTPSLILAQNHTNPEAQISFAKENRSLEYYVVQADLWWQAIEKDSSNEMAWWNYYRACRNVQGSYNWSADFVRLGPNLRFGEDIVVLMEAAIPNTFVYHFVKGSTGGVDPQAGSHLMKAYQMNPDFPGLLASVVTYAISTGNDSLRIEANTRWFENRGFNANWMDFAYNLLQSVAPQGILFTQGDNDSYPVWMLQDVLGIRRDVLVINLDFLLYDGYQKRLFDGLGLAPFHFEIIDPEVYEENWNNVCIYFLKNYQGSRPVHLSYTVNQEFYAELAETDMYAQGLCFQYAPKSLPPSRNLELLRRSFRLNSLDQSLVYDASAERLFELQAHYLLFFDTLLKQNSKALTAVERQMIEILKNKLKKQEKRL